MDIIETLKRERQNIEADRAKASKPFDDKIAEIDAAIKAVIARRQGGAYSPATAQPPVMKHGAHEAGKLSIDGAIIEAVKNDNHTPRTIFLFLGDYLGIETTINSIRTRVSKLGGQGRLARDERGWVLPSEITGDTPQSENGEATAPPDTGQGANPDQNSQPSRTGE